MRISTCYQCLFGIESMTHLWVENGTKVSRGWHVLSRYLLMIMLVVIMIMIRIRIRIIRMIGDNHDEDGDDDVVI